MNSKGGRRQTRHATVPGRRPRPASGRNVSNGRAKLSGSLFLSGDGKSKFVLDGGRERPEFPRGVERPKQRALPVRTASLPKRPRHVLLPPASPAPPVRYYNDTFNTNNPELDMDKSDADSNYGSEAPPTPQQAVMRTYMTYFAVGFVVLIVIIASIIVPLSILASKPTGPTVTGFVFLRTSFTLLLDDSSSAQYISLKADFESAMNQIFKNSATYADIFQESTVTDFASAATTTTTKVEFSLVFKSGVDITRIFKNDVFAFTTEEIRKSGSPFAPLDVIQNTLAITDSCGVYCENDGTLVVIPCTCRCATGFSGTTCTTTA